MSNNPKCSRAPSFGSTKSYWKLLQTCWIKYRQTELLTVVSNKVCWAEEGLETDIQLIRTKLIQAWPCWQRLVSTQCAIGLPRREGRPTAPPTEDPLSFLTHAARWRYMTEKAKKRSSSFTHRVNELALAWSVPPTLDSSVGKALGSQSQGGQFKSFQGTEVFLYDSLWAKRFSMSVFRYSWQLQPPNGVLTWESITGDVKCMYAIYSILTVHGTDDITSMVNDSKWMSARMRQGAPTNKEDPMWYTTK